MKDLGRHQPVHEWYPKGLGSLGYTLAKELRALAVSIPLVFYFLWGPF